MYTLSHTKVNNMVVQVALWFDRCEWKWGMCMKRWSLKKDTCERSLWTNDLGGRCKLWAHCTKKIKFSIKDLFSKCDQIRSFLRIWSHFLKKSFMENFIFCVVVIAWDGKRIMHVYEGKDIGKHEGTCTCVGKDETAHDSTQ